VRAPLLASVVLAVGAVCWSLVARRDEAVYEPHIPKIEANAPCPWRGAEHDMSNWFPNATRSETRDLILSDKRVALEEQLGRRLLPEEMALHYFEVQNGTTTVGYVLPRRLKGQNGAIEIVVVLDSEHRIRALKVQSMREPAEVAQVIERIGLERQFVGAAVTNYFWPECNENIDPKGCELARLIAQGVQAQLTLWHAGKRRDTHH
jgi:hypothetical protein